MCFWYAVLQFRRKDYFSARLHVHKRVHFRQIIDYFNLTRPHEDEDDELTTLCHLTDNLEENLTSDIVSSIGFSNLLEYLRANRRVRIISQYYQMLIKWKAEEGNWKIVSQIFRKLLKLKTELKSFLKI